MKRRVVLNHAVAACRHPPLTCAATRPSRRNARSVPRSAGESCSLRLKECVAPRLDPSPLGSADPERSRADKLSPRARGIANVRLPTLGEHQAGRYSAGERFPEGRPTHCELVAENSLRWQPVLGGSSRSGISSSSWSKILFRQTSPACSTVKDIARGSRANLRGRILICGYSRPHSVQNA